MQGAQTVEHRRLLNEQTAIDGHIVQIARNLIMGI